jgi:hypothetical protein
VPLSAEDKQVEQSRAPSLLVHLLELAGRAPARLRNDRGLIAGTTTAKGLTVSCRLDRRRYPVGRRVSDEAFATVNLTRNAFHGEWNYSIDPRPKP